MHERLSKKWGDMGNVEQEEERILWNKDKKLIMRELGRIGDAKDRKGRNERKSRKRENEEQKRIGKPRSDDTWFT